MTYVDKVHFPHKDQSERIGYGGMSHVKGKTVITACGLVFRLRWDDHRYTTQAPQVTCGSCISHANLGKKLGRRTKVPFLRIIDGAA
jgi:hypothetical protein